MGIFIGIEVDQNQITTEIAEQIVSLCPVDIFILASGRLAIQPEQEDECTLCELCLDAAPAGALTINKRYKNETLISRGKP
jgi:NAD-dependent dihydropyrimidine dehydrogenase PreA subunit